MARPKNEMESAQLSVTLDAKTLEAVKEWIEITATRPPCIRLNLSAAVRSLVVIALAAERERLSRV
jgi:hypothetical protein